MSDSQSGTKRTSFITFIFRFAFYEKPNNFGAIKGFSFQKWPLGRSKLQR